MLYGRACIDSPLGGPKGQGAVQWEGSMLASSSMPAGSATLSGRTLHEHGRQLSVRRRLRWLMAALTLANVVLWSVVFGF